jgi:leukotriene-A4 hydrolase
VQIKNSKHPEFETTLVKDLQGIDPEDVFNKVPYEKGHTLLFYLETLLGGAKVFDPYVKAYTQHFRGKSITTDMFKAHLYSHFADKKSVLDSVDWNAWFFGVGMPPVIPT